MLRDSSIDKHLGRRWGNSFKVANRGVYILE